MNNSLPAAASLHRQLGFVLALRQALRDLTLFALLWGLVALILRTTGTGSPVWPWWGAAAIPIVAAIASIRALRLRPSHDTVVALIDAQSHAGGLVIAAHTTDVGAWHTKLANIEAPRVTWTGRRTAWYTAAAFLFAFAALLVPQRQAATSRHALDVTSDIDRAESKLKLLEEEKVLPPERVEAMKQSLEPLRKEATGEDPAKAWETLDSIAEATARAARDAAESSMRKTESLTRVEAMSEVLQDHQLSGSDLAEGMRSLADEASQPEVLSSLPPEAQQAAAKGAFSDRELRGMSKAARDNKDQIRRTLDKLSAAGLIDPKSVTRRTDLEDSVDLAKYLHDHMGQGMKSAAKKWRPGKGGVDRGRGDAPMFYGEKSDPAGTAWKAQELPPSATALQNSELLAVSASAPDRAHPQASTSGALNNAAAGDGSAFNSVLLPRHRGAVKRFFERKTP